MTKRISNAETTSSGRKRVRLGGKGHSNRHKTEDHMKKMWKARDKSRAEAPRNGRGKGFAANNYAYKRLLELKKDNEYFPESKITYNPDADPPSRTSTHVPLFIRMPKVADKMIDMLEEGIPYGTVCRYVGIDPNTFKRWLEIGTKGTNPLYTEFWQRVARAESQAEINLLEKMDGHHEKDWKSIAWTLERRWPEHWARTDKHEIGGLLTISTKEKLAEEVANDPDTLELARRVLGDGTVEFTLDTDNVLESNFVNTDGDGHED